MNLGERVIIFDGVCNACNYWVDFVENRRGEKDFEYVANQTPEGKALLEKFGKSSGDVSTIYFLDQGRLYEQSNAVLRILWNIGGVWKLTAGLKIFPRFLRDWIYRWIARNRYKWFGVRESCRVVVKKSAAGKN